jgi:hypothetical protein
MTLLTIALITFAEVGYGFACYERGCNHGLEQAEKIMRPLQDSIVKEIEKLRMR